MLIGIDMLGVQSPEGSDRESGRYTHQLVSALLAGDPNNRFVLYTHEGLPTDRVPPPYKARHVSLSPEPAGPDRLRPTIQRVIDENPDGLDWLVLLDPFEPNYGGMPPESSPGGLKIASLIHDIAPSLADARRLGPLRRHDAILTPSEAIASEYRRQLGLPPGRVTALGIATDAPGDVIESSGLFSAIEADDLERVGIEGPFLLASVGRGDDRADLLAVLDAYRRLPFEHRLRQQLVIAGEVGDPWGVVAYLHESGCADGLVLVGEVDERTLRILYRRCSAYVSPSIVEGSGLPIVEAMSCGAPILAGTTGAAPSIMGDAGLLYDTSNPADIAEQLVSLLSDKVLEANLRERSLVRSAQFSWEPVVKAFLGRLGADEVFASGTRSRMDRSHVVRPRVALFPDFPRDGSNPLDLESLIPIGWRQAYEVDFYLEPGSEFLLDRLPETSSAFDVRRFDRNDAILVYRSVVYHFGDLECLELKLGRLKSRPGLVFLCDEGDFQSRTSRLLDVFLTSSRVVVGSRRLLDQIRESFPEFADSVIELPAIDLFSNAGSLEDSGTSRTSKPPLEQILDGSADLERGLMARSSLPAGDSRGRARAPSSLQSGSISSN